MIKPEVVINSDPSTAEPLRTIRRPSPSRFRVSPSSSGASPRVQTAIRRKSQSQAPRKTKSRSPAVSAPPKASTSKKRRTVNSMTLPAQYGRDLPPPNMEVQIPEPPSRSPTPPTNLVPMAKGFKFTKDDQEYFHKFIAWRLMDDPEQTRANICELLAEKVNQSIPLACFLPSYPSRHCRHPITAPSRGGRIGQTITTYQIRFLLITRPRHRR